MPILETLASAGLGMGIQAINDSRQIEQQRKLQEMQEAGNIRMMDHSQQNQYNMWLKTGAVGQMEQLKKAGLNPALMYGMSGGGGGTTGGGGSPSVSGGQAPTGGGEIQSMVGMGIQNQLLEAQKRVLETQADKNAADAAATGGVQTELGKKQIESLTQGISNQQAIEIMTRVETRIKETEAEVKSQSMQDSIDYIAWQTGKALEEMAQAESATFIQRATMNNKIDTVKGEMIGVFLRNALTKAQTEGTYKGIQKTETEIKRIIQEGIQGWKKIENETRNADSNSKNAATNEWVNDIQKSTGLPIEIIKEAVDGILRKK